jgi:hypothetical protein
MKNLAKALKWDTPWHDSSQHAYAYEDKTMYLVYEDKRNLPYFTAKFEIEKNIGWQRTRFKSIDDAKAACQKHYNESLWDNLSDEARAILEQHLNP